MPFFNQALAIHFVFIGTYDLRNTEYEILNYEILELRNSALRNSDLLPSSLILTDGINIPCLVAKYD